MSKREKAIEKQLQNYEEICKAEDEITSLEVEETEIMLELIRARRIESGFYSSSSSSDQVFYAGPTGFFESPREQEKDFIKAGVRLERYCYYVYLSYSHVLPIVVLRFNN